MGKSAGKGLIWGTYVVIIGTNKRKYLISQSELDSLHFDLFSFLYTNAAPALTRSGVCIYLQSLAEFAATGGKKTKIIFRRGLYLAENTTQAASVEFVPGGDKFCARRLQACQKSPPDFFEGKHRSGPHPERRLYVPNKKLRRVCFLEKRSEFLLTPMGGVL